MSQWNANPNQPPNTYRPGDPVPPDSVVGNSPFWQPPQPTLPDPFKPPKKRHVGRTIALIVAGLFVLIVTIAVLSPGSPTSSSPVSTVPTKVDNGPTPDPLITPTNKPSPRVTHKPAPSLTVAQEQAIGSAQSYLAMQGFSRRGLIQQLSSDAGEGFSVKDATFAVDYLKVNWNEQAVRSAKSYLEMQHFSRAGLIHQLESAYGEQFTHKQAVYGVNKAGL